jgi:hypothetical protein
MTTVELKIESSDGEKVKCICELRWRPIVGNFGSIRRQDNGAWQGFLSADAMAKLLVAQFGMIEIGQHNER